MIELINYNVRNKIDKIKYWTKIANLLKYGIKIVNFLTKCLYFEIWELKSWIF